MPLLSLVVVFDPSRRRLSLVNRNIPTASNIKRISNDVGLVSRLRLTAAGFRNIWEV